MQTTFNKSRKTTLFLVLFGIFLTNAITAEIIGAKIFSLESSLGLSPVHLPVFGTYILDFNLTAGAIIWPIVFITTDIINEYFGIDGVKKISYLTVCLIIYVFFVLWIATNLSPAEFWLKVNEKDIEGNPLNINSAYATVFRQGLGIIIGSLVAFLVGQLLDVYVFNYLRKITGKRAIWFRATGSTFVSQLIDTFIVLFVAFYVFGGQQRWEFNMILAVGTINYIYKVVVAVCLIPLLYFGHHLIDRYLGDELSEKLISEATRGYEGKKQETDYNN